MSKHISRKQQRIAFKTAIEKRLENIAERMKQDGLRQAAKIAEYRQKAAEHATYVHGAVKNKVDEFEQEYQNFIAQLKAKKEAAEKVVEEVKPVVEAVKEVAPDEVAEKIEAVETVAEVAKEIVEETIEKVEEVPAVVEEVKTAVKKSTRKKKVVEETTEEA